jgi:hypothetical protein
MRSASPWRILSVLVLADAKTFLHRRTPAYSLLSSRIRARPMHPQILPKTQKSERFYGPGLIV